MVRDFLRPLFGIVSIDALYFLTVSSLTLFGQHAIHKNHTPNITNEQNCILIKKRSQVSSVANSYEAPMHYFTGSDMRNLYSRAVKIIMKRLDNTSRLPTA